jgi:hypothetical protein
VPRRKPQKITVNAITMLFNPAVKFLKPSPVEASPVLTATTTDEVEDHTADAPPIIDYG